MRTRTKAPARSVPPIAPARLRSIFDDEPEADTVEFLPARVSIGLMLMVWVVGAVAVASV